MARHVHDVAAHARGNNILDVTFLFLKYVPALYMIIMRSFGRESLLLAHSINVVELDLDLRM